MPDRITGGIIHRRVCVRFDLDAEMFCRGVKLHRTGLSRFDRNFRRNFSVAVKSDHGFIFR